MRGLEKLAARLVREFEDHETNELMETHAALCRIGKRNEWPSIVVGRLARIEFELLLRGVQLGADGVDRVYVAGVQGRLTPPSG